ncbi:MAG: HD domain-containing protein [Nitrospirae bacterium]|nr:HD domain-containing protein [Nitrospirota bacterium]
MKSKLSITVIIFAFLIFTGYLYYDYKHHGEWITKHLFSTQNPFDAVFFILVLCAFIGSFIAAYFINDRKKLLDQTKHSEEQLRHAAREWTATFDSMPYGVLLTDGECNIIRANQYIAGLSGVPARDLVFRKKCQDTVCMKDRSNLCHVHNAAKNKATGNYEFYNRKYNKFFSESITPMLNDEGNVVTYVHVLVDITDMKEKEYKLIQSKDAFFNMLKDMDATYKEMRAVYDGLIVTFSNILDAKSSWTRGHSIEVAQYATAIAREMGLSELEIETLRVAALLHDIGKIGTYDVILDKPDTLTDEEFSLIRTHTIKGEEILRPIKGLDKILPIVRSHHEKVNGAGYPDGLKGDEIPFLARILCVADSFDAMVSDRPYRLSRGRQYAVTELKQCSGEQFDPHIVDAFVNTMERVSAA